MTITTTVTRHVHGTTFLHRWSHIHFNDCHIQHSLLGPADICHSRRLARPSGLLIRFTKCFTFTIAFLWIANTCYVQCCHENFPFNLKNVTCCIRIVTALLHMDDTCHPHGQQLSTMLFSIVNSLVVKHMTVKCSCHVSSNCVMSPDSLLSPVVVMCHQRGCLQSCCQVSPVVVMCHQVLS